MSEHLTAEERRWLAKDCPDIDYAEPGDHACSSCDTHALNLVTTVERILTARLAAAWSEGWKQGTGDAWQNGGHESKPNPYRAALHPDPSETHPTEGA